MAKELDTSKYLGVFDIDRKKLFSDIFIEGYSEHVDKYFEENLSEELKLSIAKDLIRILVRHLCYAFGLDFSEYSETSALPAI